MGRLNLVLETSEIMDPRVLGFLVVIFATAIMHVRGAPQRCYDAASCDRGPADSGSCYSDSSCPNWAPYCSSSGYCPKSAQYESGGPFGRKRRSLGNLLFRK